MVLWLTYAARPVRRPALINSEPPLAVPRPPADQSAPLSVMRAMDRQTRHEIWLLALGTVLVEVPVVAIAALVIFTR
jgi:hypothetical protein